MLNVDKMVKKVRFVFVLSLFLPDFVLLNKMSDMIYKERWHDKEVRSIGFGWTVLPLRSHLIKGR